MIEKNLFILRRFSKFAFLFVLVLSPIMQIIRTFRQDPYPYLESPLLRSDWLINLLTNKFHYASDQLTPFFVDVSGGPYNLRIWDMHFFEPLTSFIFLWERILSWDSISGSVLFASLVPIIAAIILGRVFCGYICPFSTLGKLSLRLRTKLHLPAPKISASTRTTPTVVRILVIASILALSFLFPNYLQFVLPPAVMQHAWSDFILFGGLTAWSAILLILIALEVLFPTLFCRALCPTGLFLNYIAKFKQVPLRYRKRTSCQKECNECNEKCWLNLNPKNKIEDSACDSCMECARVCPVKRIKIYRAPPLESKSPKTPSGKTSILLLILTLMILAPDKSLADIKTAFEKGRSLDYVEFVLFEKHTTAQHKKTKAKLEISYSLVASYKSMKYSGPAKCYLHLKSGDSIYTKPITVVIRSEEIERTIQIKGVNAPLSIVKMSSYSWDVNFIRSQNMVIRIISPDLDFEPIEYTIRYPIKRF